MGGMEPVEDFEVDDWQERGFSRKPEYVFLSGPIGEDGVQEIAEDGRRKEAEGKLFEVGPGVVIDRGVNKRKLWKEFMGPLRLEAWWMHRDAFLESGKDYFKFLQCSVEQINPKLLDDEGVPRLTVYTRRKLNGWYIAFYEGQMSQKMQGRELVEKGWEPTIEHPVPLVRCRNIDERGLRCASWSLRGSTLCIKHGAQLGTVKRHAEAVLEAARREIIGAAPVALETLIELTGKNSPEGVRLKAAESLLDRAGIKGGFEIDVKVSNQESAVENIMDRFNQIVGRSGADEEEDLGILDAEIVEEDLD